MSSEEKKSTVVRRRIPVDAKGRNALLNNVVEALNKDVLRVGPYEFEAIDGVLLSAGKCNSEIDRTQRYPLHICNHLDCVECTKTNKELERDKTGNTLRFACPYGQEPLIQVTLRRRPQR